MPSTYTPSLHLELQATGENNGTWGQNLNNNVFTTLDNVIGNSANISLSGSDVTLTISQTQCNYFTLLGTLTANVNVIFPSFGSTIFVFNATTGNFTVSLRMSDPSSSVLPIAQGTTGFFILNHIDIVAAPNVSGPVTATTGNLPVFTGNSGQLLVDSGVQAPIIANQTQAEAGTSNTVYNTPLRTTQQTTARVASQGSAQAGTDNFSLMTPLRTAQAIQAQATPYPSTTGDVNNLNYPIGTVLAVNGLINRNQPTPIYLASDATQFQTTPSPSQLAGTWLARGRIGSSSMLVQRAS